jgi:hypothetical protein
MIQGIFNVLLGVSVIKGYRFALTRNSEARWNPAE